MAETIADAIRAKELLVGTVLTLPGASSAELLAEPFDLVWVDLEHGALDRLDAQEMILGAQAAGSFALVRLPVNDHSTMAVMLDAGADGIVLAGVGDARDASAALQRVVHPPGGTRGWGPRRVSLRQRTTGQAPPAPSIWVQIEDAEAVKVAPDIAAVPGIDAIVIGTADLSFSLGAPLDLTANELRDAVAAVRHEAERVGIAFGIAGALDLAGDDLHEGASILVHGTDARLCAKAVDDAAVWLRDLPKDRRKGATR